MGQHAFVIRPSTPDDASIAAVLIALSAPVAFEYVLGPDPERFLRGAFGRGGRFGHQIHTVVEYGGAVVGVMAAYGHPELLGVQIGTAYSFLADSIVKMPGRIARGLAMDAMLPPPKRGEIFFGHLAVVPQMRAFAVGAKLLRHQIERARAQGFARIVGDVAVDNPRAEALYLKMGFVPEGTKESTLRCGDRPVPAHRRMVMSL